jgi:hypothetical protein
VGNLSDQTLEELDNLLSDDMIKNVKMVVKRLATGEREVTLRGMANGKRLIVRAEGKSLEDAFQNVFPALALRLGKSMLVPPLEP